MSLPEQIAGTTDPPAFKGSLSISRISLKAARLGRKSFISVNVIADSGFVFQKDRFVTYASIMR